MPAIFYGMALVNFACAACTGSVVNLMVGVSNLAVGAMWSTSDADEE